MKHTVGLASVFGAVSLVLAKSAYVARVTSFWDAAASENNNGENAAAWANLAKTEKVEKIKTAENQHVAPLESAPARITVAADELGADGVVLDDVVDRVAENVGEEVGENLNFRGLSEEIEEISEKNQNFSEKQKKFQKKDELVAKKDEVWCCDVESEVAGGVDEDFSDEQELDGKKKLRNCRKKSGLSEGIYRIAKNVKHYENSEKDKKFENFEKDYKNANNFEFVYNERALDDKDSKSVNKVVNSVGMMLDFGGNDDEVFEKE